MKKIPADLHPGLWIIIYLFTGILWIFDIGNVNGVCVAIAIAIATILRKIEYEVGTWREMTDLLAVNERFYELWLKDGNFPMSGNQEKDDIILELNQLLEKKEE